MRVLFLTLKTFSATGGIEKFNRCFAMALWQNTQQLGWELEVLSAYDQGAEEVYLPDTVFRGFKGKRASFSLQAIKSAKRADIIVVGHINIAAVAFAGQILFPDKHWILIAHGREVWEQSSFIQQKSLHRFNKIWSVSRFTSSILIDKQRVAPSSIGLFPNTLDPFFSAQMPSISEEQLRERYGLKNGQPILITVTRLANTEKNKGCDEVIKTLPKLLTVYPNLRYLLCGKADEPEKKRLLLMISELNLQNVVILTGFIENNELSAHYRLANVFVMPSRKEGFGIVFIEAVWWGLNVVAGNQDGSVDALLDGRLGTLVDPTDNAALETAILHSVSNPASFLEREAKRKLVLENFGFDKFKERQRNEMVCVNVI